MDVGTRISREVLLNTIRHYDQDVDDTNQIFSSLLNKRVLVACSGGADSIALFLFCIAYGLDIALTYIEHGLSEETKICQDIVNSLAAQYKAPFYIEHLELHSNKKLDSNIEAVARQHRYEALEKIRVTNDYDVILTAHHEDDYVETFLINLLRGSGSKISSLQKYREVLVRPLLHWRKSTLIELVTSLGFDFFDDPMNHSDRFVRNRIRNEVIPLLGNISKRDVTPLIARASRHIANDNDYLDALATSLWPKESPTTSSLRQLDDVIQVHALRCWIQGYPPSESEMRAIFDVVTHKTKSIQLSGGRTIWRRGGVLYQDRTEQYLAKRDISK